MDQQKFTGFEINEQAKISEESSTKDAKTNALRALSIFKVTHPNAGWEPSDQCAHIYIALQTLLRRTKANARVSNKVLLQYSDKVVQTSAIKTLYYVVPIANLTEAKISLLNEQYPGWRVDFNLVQDCPADISEDSHIIVDKFVDKAILGPGVIRAELMVANTRTFKSESARGSAMADIGIGLGRSSPPLRDAEAPTGEAPASAPESGIGVPLTAEIGVDDGGPSSQDSGTVPIDKTYKTLAANVVTAMEEKHYASSDKANPALGSGVAGMPRPHPLGRRQ